MQLNPLPRRSIQIGLSGEAVVRYVHEWTVRITEITPLAHEICHLVQENRLDEAQLLLPQERMYPVTAVSGMGNKGQNSG